MKTIMQTVKDRCVVDAATGCWNWTGASTNGRPYLRAEGKTRLVYRALYEELEGVQLPRCVFVCHKCDNGLCCNPKHLFTGTQAENMRDMANKGRHFSKTKPAAFKAATEKARAVLAANPHLRPHGSRHWTKTSPENVKRGADHWTKKKPQLIRRGTANSQFTFSEEQLREIAKSDATNVALSKKFKCHHSTISRARRLGREALKS